MLSTVEIKKEVCFCICIVWITDIDYQIPRLDPVRSHTLTFTGTKSCTRTSVTLHFNPNNGLFKKALYLICHFPWNNSVLKQCESTQTPHPTISKIIPIVSSNLYRLLTTNSFWLEMIVHPCCEILSALHSKLIRTSQRFFTWRKPFSLTVLCWGTSHI